jgi:HEPN domain-containing protein
MTPDQPEAWLAVANERAADAEALLLKRKTSSGCAYMAGYAIECSLKAYLQGSGTAFPTSGGEGHNLRGLWRRSGFQISDLQDANGAKAFFLKQWSTDLRYEVALPTHLRAEELLQGAKALNGWLQTRCRRRGGRRKRRIRAKSASTLQGTSRGYLGLLPKSECSRPPQEEGGGSRLCRPDSGSEPRKIAVRWPWPDCLRSRLTGWIC